MLSKVEIWNNALALAGSKVFIDSEDESSPLAAAVRVVYSSTVTAALSDFDWYFARVSEDLNLIDEVDDGSRPWRFKYAWPGNVLVPRYIRRPEIEIKPDPPVRYRIEFDPGTMAKVLFTDQADATLVYTYDLTDESLWEGYFTDAFTWGLAAKVIVNLTKNSRKGAELYGVYLRAIENAKTTAANSDSPTFNREAPNRYLRARGYSTQDYDYDGT